MSELLETAKRYGWAVIVFADGAPVAFCPRDPRRVDDWNLAGGGSGAWTVALANELIAKAKVDFGGDNRFRIVRKLLRRQLNELRLKNWEDVIRGPVQDWADTRIMALSEGLDYVDNTRVALKGNTAQVRRYMRDKSGGCCGFHDSEEVCPIDGRTYLLGFNFGH